MKTPKQIIEQEIRKHHRTLKFKPVCPGYPVKEIKRKMLEISLNLPHEWGNKGHARVRKTIYY